MTENNKLTSLIAGCRRMEESSQIGLYRHYYSYGMSICLRYARDRESALEMLNDGFLKVFLKIEQYDSDYPFRPWLRKVLVNASIDYYRKYYQDKTEDYKYIEKEMPAYNEALDRLEYDDLMKILHLLPPAYRLVFNLYVVEGLPHADIADRLGISIGASKSNLAKARRKIKELLRSSHDIHMKI